jgi:DNA-binding CsgD family transcriptional regulator
MDRGAHRATTLGVDDRAPRQRWRHTIDIIPLVGLPTGLTAREREVLSLLRHQFTDAEIAATLCISRRTASHHVGKILEKLGAANRREAGRLAMLLSQG